MRYFLTFACYGAHLHGDDAGSVDRGHHLSGAPMLEANADRVAAERRIMNQAAYELSGDGRMIVLASLREVCSHRAWKLLAAHVWSNHVHMIVEAGVPPEKDDE